jgi:hypothetical protein
MAGMLLLVLLLRPALRAAHALFFKRDTRDDASANTTNELDPAHAAALPPAHSIPVNGFASTHPDAADIIAPPSVAEGTTRKLKDL